MQTTLLHYTNSNNNGIGEVLTKEVFDQCLKGFVKRNNHIKLVNGKYEETFFALSYGLDVSRHTILKGLKLVQFQKTKKKYFILRYWFNSKNRDLTIGEFVLDKFSCRECENKVFEIAKAHQDNKGINQSLY